MDYKQYHQEGPRLGNQYLEDESLKRYLQALLPSYILEELVPFGDKCSGEYLRMSHNAELFKPMFEQYDAWGKRVDRIHLSEGWKYFKKESAKEGLVSIPYEGGEHGRLHQTAKLLFFAPSSGMYSCPLAMTDGAAFVIRDILKTKVLPEGTKAKLEGAYSHLTSRDPFNFWTSGTYFVFIFEIFHSNIVLVGQWFTEKKGGSDLSGSTDTVAVPKNDGTYGLYGYKWFTSAIDAEMTLTLGCIADSKIVNPDRKPLSLFFMEIQKPASTQEEEEQDKDILNGIQVVRLKDKMGTKQLPTAELILEDAQAHLLSTPGAGIKSVSPMLVITRYHNSIGAVSNMIRMRNLVMDFAHRRSAFGAMIADKPLHMQSLFEFDADTRGSLLLVLEFSRLLGLVETTKASNQERAILRVITPLSKVFTAREAVRLMSEGVEMFGAVGVMENSHISVLLRDTSVLPIWEGTTNTLSLDVIRVITKSPESLTALKLSLDKRLDQASQVVFGFEKFEHNLLEWNAKRITMNLSKLLVTDLVLKMADKTNHPDDVSLADYWLQKLEHLEKMSTPKSFKKVDKNEFGKNRDTRGIVRSSL